MKPIHSCWLIPIALLMSGCTKSDADVLAGIGRKIAQRAQAVSGNVENSWSKNPNALAIELRVKNRLRWDKALADAAIEVHTTDAVVELKGVLPSAEQVRRAVDLAESTAGVEKVVNSLRVE